jgi:hypothetical protein
MKKYNVVLKSVTPYMQHRMDDLSLAEWERDRGNIIERPEVSQQDSHRAEYHSYKNEQGQYYMPSEHIRNCLIAAGSYVKAKVGGRSKSMKVIVAAMFMVTPEQIILPPYDQIDKRSAVNKNVKARVITVRPKWSEWQVSFTLEVGENSVTIDTISSIFNNAGQYCGIGSFRPTNNGMFGRFELVSIAEIAENNIVARTTTRRRGTASLNDGVESMMM